MKLGRFLSMIGLLLAASAPSIIIAANDDKTTTTNLLKSTSYNNGVKKYKANGLFRERQPSVSAGGSTPDGEGQRRDLGQVDSAIDGKWQQFRHWSVGSQALTCGSACIPGLNSEYAPPAPWEFELPPGGGCFMVVDAFEVTDQYNVTDFDNVTIGITSEPKGSGSCGKDPEACFSTKGASRGSFYLAEGPHSVMITVAQGGAGSAFFRVVTDVSACQHDGGTSSPSTLAPVGRTKSPAPTAALDSTASPAPTSSRSSPAPTSSTSSPAPTSSTSSPAPTSPSSSPSPSSNSVPPTSQNNRSPIAKCKPKVVWPAKADCSTRVNIDDGSFDPDDGDTIRMVQNPRGPYKVGTRNVTLTVTDNAGNSDSCVTLVTIMDDEKIDQDSIDCGIADWHIQACEPPVTYSASYKKSSASSPNKKENGCPVTVAISSKDMICERCAGIAERNRIVDVKCGNVVSANGQDITLSRQKDYGFFMSWELTATDKRGRSVSKQCGVCVETGGDCRRTTEENDSTEQRHFYRNNNLKRRLADTVVCPDKVPESSDGSIAWPEHSLSEIDNCAAILGN